MTTRYEMLSLMDGFSSYNQIRIAPEDQHKITFMFPWGKYCWNFMPFGLKNVGATYQRPMNNIFHHYMHILMEDYTGYFLCKSPKRRDHLGILDKILSRMEGYKI